MNSENYLVSRGWRKGEAFKHGGLKKPILVKHKKDTKGLGHRGDEQDAWWERVFDGQLKSLDVNASSQGVVTFKQNEVKVSGLKKADSPLYRMFVYGGMLEGTIESMKRQREEAAAAAATAAAPKSDDTRVKKRKREDASSSSSKKSKSKSKDKKKKRRKDKKKCDSTPSSEEEWIRSLVRSVSEPVAAS